MPNLFEDDSSYPFAAFITNLGKYNEGVLVGEWVKFPTTAEELKRVFDRIGIGAKDDFGQTYEEWFITDYDCYVDGIYNALSEHADLNELNFLASRLKEMTPYDLDLFRAAIEIDDDADSVKGLINLSLNLYRYDLITSVENESDLGQYYIDAVDCIEIPEAIKSYIDYKSYGADIACCETSAFTKYGYVHEVDSSGSERYGGSKTDIPEPYLLI